MCLLIVLREIVPDWPLVIAANREERYDRLGDPPQLLCENPKIFGGRDPRAGGTWLAVNQWAMVCAVTNRPRNPPPSGEVRSRGLLCLDMARQRSPIAVADAMARSLAENDYDGFNLLCLTPTSGSAFYFDARLREKPLAHGVFVVTTGDANDFAHRKVRRVHEMLDTERRRSIAEWIAQIETICRSHAGDHNPDESPCMHGEKSGTVSSTILAFHSHDPKRHMFRHCQGKPCEAPYETVRWPDSFFALSSSGEMSYP
jgi:uncharacterized protein with NRDE domain